MMAAACFSEVHAVAEVPQLDFRLWQRRAVLDVEKYLLNGADISAFTKKHPERVSVLHRFIKENRIPQFTIITNGTDFRIREQRLFMKWVSRSNLPKGGLNLLIETDGTTGHNVLEKGDILPFIVPKNR